MAEEFIRTEKLIGKENLDLLRTKTVAIFGLGGVGSYTTESLARCGIGNFILVDNDVVSESNINRQLYALHSTIGKLKTDCAKERILDINPCANVKTYPIFYLKETASQIDLSGVDYIIDCVDTVSAKILLAEQAQMFHVKQISSMGTGNKLDPAKFLIADIYKTSVCPLARVMRHELKKRGIKHLKVLYSTEIPITINPVATANRDAATNNTAINKATTFFKAVPASISFVPSVAGLLIASEVVKDLISN